MGQFQKLHKEDFEQIVYCHDEKVGLHSIIAIHDTTLGPAVGGVRLYPYKTEEDALKDVMRLAVGMTYKASISGLDWGGGKAVIIADPKTGKTKPLLERFGQFVESLRGKYITAKDVNINHQDLKVIKTRTSHVLGILGEAHSSGDPSPATAFGVVEGIKACLQRVYGTEQFKGLHIVIQGIGSVGKNIGDTLAKLGARLTITDVRENVVKEYQEKWKADVVPTEKIYDVPCDIFAPCALGGTLNSRTIPRLKCRIVAGCANNQFEADEDGYRLHKQGILYAPDYVINAGGLINISLESNDYDHDRAWGKIAGIYGTLIKIFDRSKLESLPPHAVANRIAEERIEKKKAAGKRA